MDEDFCIAHAVTGRQLTETSTDKFTFSWPIHFTLLVSSVHVTVKFLAF
jgi:hypothetical protein